MSSPAEQQLAVFQLLTEIEATARTAREAIVNANAAAAEAQRPQLAIAGRLNGHHPTQAQYAQAAEQHARVYHAHAQQMIRAAVQFQGLYTGQVSESSAPDDPIPPGQANGE